MKAGITVDQMVLAQNVVGIGLAAVAAAADHQIETGFGLLPDALKLLVVWTVSVQLGTRLTMSVIKEVCVRASVRLCVSLYVCRCVCVCAFARACVCASVCMRACGCMLWCMCV